MKNVTLIKLAIVSALAVGVIPYAQADGGVTSEQDRLIAELCENYADTQEVAATAETPRGHWLPEREEKAVWNILFPFLLLIVVLNVLAQPNRRRWLIISAPIILASAYHYAGDGETSAPIVLACLITTLILSFYFWVKTGVEAEREREVARTLA
jgi:divalent metal cation (Fe/Co/Zn/Cd) transporter